MDVPKYRQSKLSRANRVLRPVEYTGVSLLPNGPQRSDDQRAETSLLLSVKSSPRPEPPLLEWLLPIRDANIYLQSVKTRVPNFSRVEALHQNVLDVIPILQANVTNRKLILKTMAKNELPLTYS